MPLHGHRPVGGHPGQDVAADAEPAHQGAGPAIDEPLHQLLVQGVGDPVLELTRPALPVGRILQPVGAVGDIGHGAHPREPGRQRIYVAVDVVERSVLPLDPVVGDAPRARRQLAEDRLQQPQMLIQARLAEVRRLADFPEQPQTVRIAAEVLNLVLLRQLAQAGLVERLGGQLEPRPVGLGRQRTHQRRQRAEVEPGVAPLGGLHPIEPVVLDRRHEIRIDLRTIPGHPEGPIGAVAAGAAGDLADLLGAQPARALAVVLA